MLGKRAADLAPVGALLLLMIVFTIADRQFLTWGNFRGVFDQSAVPLVLGVGMTYVILLGAIDLSVEGMLVASSLAVALLVADKTNDVDIGMFPALVVGILIGVAMGFVNGLVNTRFKIPSFMVTLGMWSVGLGIGQILFGNVPPRIENEVRAWGSYGNNPFRWFGVTRLFYLALAVVFIGYLIQRWTKVGRYAYAIGGNEELAKQSGINIARYKTYAFMLAGAMFGLAGGMLLTRTGVGDLRAAQGFLFLTIAGVVIGGTLLMGGRGGVLHSSVGIFIMVVLNNGMVVLGVSQFWQDAVAGFIVVAAVVITGLASRRRMRVVP
jgi:ribose transport system permease protein